MKKILQVAGLALVIGFTSFVGYTSANIVGSDVQKRGNLVEVFENTDAALEQFKVTDQPFLILRFKEGWKYPVVMKGDPRCFRWDILLLGSHNEKYNENRLIKRSNQLETLAVLRSIETYADSYGIKIDKQFQGSRDAFLAVGLENVLKFVGLMASEAYKGKIIVDEYNEGMPMKWVLGSTAELKGMVKYFAKQHVVPAAKKPLLLLQVLDSKAVIGEDEQNFLKTYFTMLDAKNAAVKAFFDGAEEYLSGAANSSEKAKDVLETPGTTFFRTVIDKYFEGLEMKKMGGLGFGVAVFVAYALAADAAKDAVKGTAAWKNFVDLLTVQTGIDSKGNAQYGASDFTKNAALGAGGAVGLYLLYKMISEFVKANDVDCNADDEEVAA